MTSKSTGGKRGDEITTATRSTKAGLHLPVGRIRRCPRKGRFANRIGAGAPTVPRSTVAEETTAESLPGPRSVLASSDRLQAG
ncbi:hypothetical protein DMC30DRAFT_414145 [Rhodotorula diobovata]|uniref:Uncharacterized protein n=1 Tax=Rhodotorula diobovata TaxID=5288 RepID=A0A5C5G4K2_9BASI|nr:hypothetical protein DMC30DRAFT_414145 [Rhodotorula diobovata]